MSNFSNLILFCLITHLGGSRSTPSATAYMIKFTQEQNQVANERRDKDAIDFPRAAVIGLQFPAEKLG
jgi:hypothetical protein